MNSDYFRLDQVADGVFAAIVRPGTGAWGNAAIVDLGDRTLLFDSFFTPRAADDLRRAAEAVTGRAPAYVVNSHRDLDHMFGNQVFDEASIISSEAARADMAVSKPPYLQMPKEKAQQYLSSLEGRVAAQTDPLRREEAEWELGEWRAFTEALPTLRLRLPELTFHSELVLRGSRRTAHLKVVPAMHTDSDVILHIPEERVAILGDIVQVGFHPGLRAGSPAGWLQALEQVTALGAERIVSGHGPVGGPADVALMVQYVQELERLARQVVQAGGTADDAAQVMVPEWCREWRYPSIFGASLRLVYQTIK